MRHLYMNAGHAPQSHQLVMPGHEDERKDNPLPPVHRVGLASRCGLWLPPL